MQAVFTICVVGGNLSNGAAMKYSYIIEIAAIPPKPFAQELRLTLVNLVVEFTR